MSRKPTGTIQPHGDHYDARVTMRDGTRPWICLPAGETEERSRERAAAMSEMARAPGSTYDPRGAKVAACETLEAYVGRWTADRLARGITSASDDPGRLRKHCNTLWNRPIAAITRDDIEAIVEDLDGAVADEEMAAGNAKIIWKTLRRAFEDATNAKTRALRVLTANPCLGVRGPDPGTQRSKAWIYPSEFLRLVACSEVPRHRRRVYALGVYLYARINEIRAIGLEDVDPEHDLVHVHRAIDRKTKAEKSTKAGRPRRMPVEPNVAPLVRVLYAEAETAARPRLVALAWSDWSRALRADLLIAGVTRAELHAGDATRQRLRFHDLRATGITWAGIRGDDPLKIRQRAGHAKFATTERYLRTAETVGPGFGDPFPPLPDDLLLPEEEGPPGPARPRGRRRGGGGGQGTGGQSSVKSSGGIASVTRKRKRSSSIQSDFDAATVEVATVRAGRLHEHPAGCTKSWRAAGLCSQAAGKHMPAAGRRRITAATARSGDTTAVACSGTRRRAAGSRSLAAGRAVRAPASACAQPASACVQPASACAQQEGSVLQPATPSCSRTAPPCSRNGKKTLHAGAVLQPARASGARPAHPAAGKHLRAAGERLLDARKHLRAAGKLLLAAGEGRPAAGQPGVQQDSPACSRTARRAAGQPGVQQDSPTGT